jgi:hypothetical protein
MQFEPRAARPSCAARQPHPPVAARQPHPPVALVAPATENQEEAVGGFVRGHK